MFCTQCNVLTEGNRCHLCGSKALRMPEPDDYCFLTEQDQIWAGMLEDVLSQNDIRCITRNILGAGITAKIGPLMERTICYVPYSAYEDAKALVSELFSAEADMQAE